MYIFTSPAGAVAKCCNEHVCLSVCLVSICPSGYLRNNTRDLTIFSVCCLWPWLGPPPAEWRNPKGKGLFWGFSSPLTMHCNAFARKGTTWTPITSCSRRIIRSLPRSMQMGSAGKGVMGCTARGAGEVWSMIALLYEQTYENFDDTRTRIDRLHVFITTRR